MSKKWILLAGALSLGSAGASQAHPPDSPDIAYVEMPRTAIAASRAANRIAFNSETTPAKIADLPAAASATANSSTPTTQEEVEAALAASAIPAPEQKAKNAGPSGHFTTGQSSAAEKTAVVSKTGTDGLVALVMAHQDVNSVSDLANRDIAIDDKISASSAGIRAAITAAGATEAQLSEGHTGAIDRLVGGEVAAAVLALVSPEAAEWFPEIEGFNIFRIPLSPRSLKPQP